MKKSLAAAGLGVALAAATPVQAQTAQEPMRIGVLQVDSSNVITSDRNTRIQSRQFAPGGQGASAGAETQSAVSTFIQQARLIDRERPIEVYSANVGQGSQGVDHDGARQALQWFKQNNVTVVVSLADGRDAEAMRGVMQEAHRGGLVVFSADRGNAGQTPMISVAAEGRAQSAQVDFTLDGTERNESGQAGWASSSFAAAKAAAFGSFAVATGNAQDRATVVAYMRDFAEERSQSIAGRNVTVAYLDEREAALSASETGECLAEEMQARQERGAALLRQTSKGPADGMQVAQLGRSTGAER